MNDLTNLAGYINDTKRIYRKLDIRYTDYKEYVAFCKYRQYYPIDFKEEWIPVFKTLIRLDYNGS